MNKLTKFITDLKLGEKGYRGIDLFQQTGLTNNVDCIVDTLRIVSQYGDKMPCRCDDIEMLSMVQRLDGYSGASCKGIRKNFFPDLESLGFVKRHGRGKNWDYISVTEYGLELINETNVFIRQEIIEQGYRRFRNQNTEFRDFLWRLKEVTDLFGGVYWWEVWMCMRLDVDFHTLVTKMVGIRKEFRIKKNTLKGINEVTKLFSEHNKKGVKRNGSIDFDNVLNKVTSFGIKATFFFFSVEGRGRMTIIKSQFDTSTKKAQRTYKRNPYYIVDGNDKGLEYHHIVPFENVHYNLKVHDMIDCRDNLIPITPEDHLKFPKSNNDFVKVMIIDGQVRFYSLNKKEKFIQLENTNHLNIDLIQKHMVEFNKKLITKIF